MPVLFSITLFLSAALLFLVELMFGGMILPKFGGAPAVWNTCMVFFQAAMLAGYAYAHVLPARLGVRRHRALHLLLLLVPLAFLPIAARFDPPGDGVPVLWILFLLLASVGLPFFVVSTTNPLLQKWFSETGHPAARDPYFLYAASNLGSMLALLAYPLIPALVVGAPDPVTGSRHGLGFHAQSLWWTGGYVALVGMIAACAYVTWKAPRTEKSADAPAAVDVAAPPPRRGRILGWIALAFVPSSLMLGVTTYLSTDVSAGPLIWIPPLALYLLSFILAFSRLPDWFHKIMVRSLPILILLQTYAILVNANQPRNLLVVLHLTTLFVVSMVCHGRLAQSRPDPKYLTAFYLWISVGGVLGGMFNALVAPLLFAGIAEYPLVLALSCTLLPNLDGDLEAAAPIRGQRVALPFVLGMLAAVLVFRVAIEIVTIFGSSGEVHVPVAWRAVLMLALGLPLLVFAARVCHDHVRAERPDVRASTFRYLLLAGVVVGSLVQTAAIATGLSAVQLAAWCLGVPLAFLFVCFLMPLTPRRLSPDVKGPDSLVRLGSDPVISGPLDSWAFDVGIPAVFAVLVGVHLVMLNRDPATADRLKGALAELQELYTWAHAMAPSIAWIVPQKAPALANVGMLLNFFPILLCYAWVRRPVRFGLGILAVLLATAFFTTFFDDSVLFRDRSFFGVLNVKQTWETDEEVGRVGYHTLMHGTTLHGQQEIDENNLPLRGAQPLTYYHRSGPLGQVFGMIEENADVRPVAVIGLGTGTTAFYGKPGQDFVFYEIDAHVRAIAADRRYFSYLTEARERGVKLDFVLGDARLSLKKDPATDREGRADGFYRLIAVDAFSSDAIPVHLITYEATQLYLQKLAADGIIACHVSNRYLDLQPVLSTLAKTAGLKGLVRMDERGTGKDLGKFPSIWVILARNDLAEKAFGSILKDVRDPALDDSLQEEIRPLEAKITALAGAERQAAEKALAKVEEKRAANARKRWYWIDQRQHWDRDSQDDVELWTDDYQNVLGILR